MKSNPLMLLSAAFLAALNLGSGPYQKERDDWRAGRKRRKKGSGKGGAGVTLKKQFPRKFPYGYATQQIPLQHMHGHARRRAIAAGATL